MKAPGRIFFLLGDQLDREGAWRGAIDPGEDLVLFAEVREESVKVPSHKVRTALFLSGMRHFARELEDDGCRVRYVALDDPENTHSLHGELARCIGEHNPREVHLVFPGEHAIREKLHDVVNGSGAGLHEHEDRHFFSTPDEFARWAEGRKQLRMEYFYRERRKATGYLMEGTEPAGGKWNYDKENRKSFPKSGPGDLSAPRAFPPDVITMEVLALVEEAFPGHPGDLATFDWPVTPDDARAALDDFIQHRLGAFGDYQDAMWTGEPWLCHSRLSAALNLKLLDPREACEAAIGAHRSGGAPLAAVEGFVRQILGWREYVRGLYWMHMPDYLDLNALGAGNKLPGIYWTGDTEFTCLRESLGQTLRFGYAHHIQRLMVTGLFAMLYGVRPKEIHEWYLAVYVDAVEWVELPNVAGMSQWADGGIMASKPYAATGKYIQRMSNYCRQCPRDPKVRTGDRACPFTTLYWDFLLQHQGTLSRNQRMSLQVRNLQRLSDGEKDEIRSAASALRCSLART